MTDPSRDALNLGPAPPPIPATPATGTFDFNQPTIVAGLYLASLLTGITGIIGVVLAYVWQAESHPAWMDSHYRFHIRTFWMGFALGVLGAVVSVLTLGLAYLLVLPLWVVWFGVRTVRAMLAAQRQAPVENVETWLW